MVVWSEDEKDAFAELLNMGVGQAAASLSSMLDKEILLSVPEVEFLSRDEVAKRFGEKVGSDMVGVRQGFEGTVVGNCFLLFSKSGGLNLVRQLVDDDVPLDDFPDIQREAITEVGNIVLNACMAAIADSLCIEIPTDLPNFITCTPLDLDISEARVVDEAYYLSGNIRFDLMDKDINGFVVLFMTGPSAMLFRQKIRQLLSTYMVANDPA